MGPGSYLRVRSEKSNPDENMDVITSLAAVIDVAQPPEYAPRKTFKMNEYALTGGTINQNTRELSNHPTIKVSWIL